MSNTQIFKQNNSRHFILTISQNTLIKNLHNSTLEYINISSLEIWTFQKQFHKVHQLIINIKASSIVHHSSIHWMSSLGMTKSFAFWQFQKLSVNTPGQEISSESEIRLTVLQFSSSFWSGVQSLSCSMIMVSVNSWSVDVMSGFVAAVNKIYIKRCLTWYHFLSPHAYQGITCEIQYYVFYFQNKELFKYTCRLFLCH
jgi:hypothetical protein